MIHNRISICCNQSANRWSRSNQRRALVEVAQHKRLRLEAELANSAWPHDLNRFVDDNDTFLRFAQRSDGFVELESCLQMGALQETPELVDLLLGFSELLFEIPALICHLKTLIQRLKDNRWNCASRCKGSMLGIQHSLSGQPYQRNIFICSWLYLILGKLSRECRSFPWSIWTSLFNVSFLDADFRMLSACFVRVSGLPKPTP